MLKEFVEFLLDKTSVETFEYAGRDYTSRAIAPVKPPLPDCVNFNTLTGFAKFAQRWTSSEVLVHVVKTDLVRLIDVTTDDWEQRAVFAAATLAEHGHPFPFGQFLDPEAFIIGLQAHFVESPERAAVLKVAGNLTADSAIEVEDDGITQRVGQKAGVVLKSRVELPSPLVLAPWRTFREAKQPATAFILRAKQEREGALPKLALFEADGGMWKLEAIKNVAAFLGEQLPGFTVLA